MVGSYSLKRTGVLLIVINLCVILFTSCKETIYISMEGSDSNPGSHGYPMKTMEGAFDRVKKIRDSGSQKRIELRMSAGTFFVPNTLLLDGNSYDNLDIVGDGVGKTFISGGVAIKESIDSHEKYSVIHLPHNLANANLMPQLFINGHRKTLARTPNINRYFTPKNFGWNRKEGAGRVGTISMTAPREEMSSLNGIKDYSSVIISVLHDWSETRRKIISLDPIRGKITMEDPIARSKQYFVRKGPKLFFMENDMSFLDTVGEYYFDRRENAVYYIPDKSENLGESEMVVPQNNILLSITGEKEKPISGITFKGITFEYTNYSMPVGGEEPYQASNQSLAAIVVNYASDIIFEDCEFSHTGEYAVWFHEGCNNCSVKRCYLHDLGAGGVKIGVTDSPFQFNKSYKLCSRITIDNNIIIEGGRILFPSSGILLMQAGDCDITHNEIADFYHSGISVGWTWGYAESPAVRNNISYNHVHHIGWGVLSDMGGIYTLGPSQGTIISNNVVHHVHSCANNAWGIYLDEGSSGIVVKNNIVYDCKTTAFHQHYGRENTIENNIFFSSSPITISKPESHKSLTFSKNIVCYDYDGQVFGESWGKSRVRCSDNLYWQKESRNIKIDQNGKYIINNKKTLRKIGFRKIKCSKAGVYGKSSWKYLSNYSGDKSQLYDRLTR